MSVRSPYSARAASSGNGCDAPQRAAQRIVDPRSGVVANAPEAAKSAGSRPSAHLRTGGAGREVGARRLALAGLLLCLIPPGMFCMGFLFGK